MTDLSPAPDRDTTAIGPLTPAGIQSLDVLNWRRMFFASVFAITYGLLAYALFRGLGLDGGRWPLAETLIFMCGLIGMPWSVIGFWNAIIGFWLLHLRG